jgi:tetratricopeptide (TPR) repeat protein
MSTWLVRNLMGGPLLMVLLAVAPPGAVLAEEGAADGAGAETETEESAADGDARDRSEERPKYVVDARTAKIFQEARDHIGAERYDEADSALARLRPGRLNAYERAQAHRIAGYVAYGRQENGTAIERLGQALAEGALPAQDQADVLFQVAQIQGVERRWRDVIATLDQWFRSVERPNSLAWFLMALSYYQLEDLDAALLPAKKAVAIAKVPQQAWLQLLLAIHLTRKDYAAATPVLVDLVSRYPNSGAGYWLQLSALYSATGNHERALGVLEVAYRRGLFSEDRDLRRLVQMTVFRQIPYRAAQILESELAKSRIRADAEAFELLSSSWILARETAKAGEPLARAAELSPKGNLYVRLAQVHLSQEQWEDAATALRKALEKGGLDDPASAQLLLGITCYNEKKLQEARTWFARAQRSSPTRQEAETWLQHVDREIAAAHSTAEAAG